MAPIQITFHGIRHSDAIERYADKRAQKLSTFFDRITRCRVAIESPHHHHQNGGNYHVQIDMSVPGSELVVTRDRKDDRTADLYAAIDSAFQDARRILAEHASRIRGRRRASSER